jgi:hypothetical protein
MKQKIFTAGLALALTAFLAGCSIFYPNTPPTPTPTPTPTQTETPTPTPTPTVDPNLKEVKINILDSSAFKDNGTVDVIAEVLGILEEDGRCTLVVSQGALSQTVVVNAESNVTSTQCFPMSVPLSAFKDGNLKFTVSYVSDKSSGVFPNGTIAIQ